MASPTPPKRSGDTLLSDQQKMQQITLAVGFMSFTWFEERHEGQTLVDDVVTKHVPPHIGLFYCLGGIVFMALVAQAGFKSFVVTWHSLSWLLGFLGHLAHWLPHLCWLSQVIRQDLLLAVRTLYVGFESHGPF